MRGSRRILRCSTLIVSFCLSAAAPSFAQREMSPEAVVFQKYRDGVVTVFGDAGHGSGFLIDQKGVIITNQHVVAKSNYLKVQISDSVCLRARLLYEDEKGDIAAIRVQPYWVRDLPTLAMRRDSVDLVYEGERVLAIGNPLSQTRLLTVGVVSKVHEGAIISDVNLNPGSSGGPIMNMDGEVVGIATFVEQSPDGGPGVSGILAIHRAFPVIDSALARADTALLPSAELLPVMPKDMFPLRILEDAAKQSKVDRKAYAISSEGFRVQVVSPTYAYWSETQYERVISEKHKKREAKGNVPDKDKYNPSDQLKDWFQYLGSYPPVVVISVIPKIGETAGSLFGNILGTVIAGAAGYYYYGHQNMEFKADLKDFVLSTRGEIVPEIRRGMVYVPMNYFEQGFGASRGGTDLARAGFFMFSPEIFEPDESGWPVVTLTMWSIDRPTRPDLLTIPQRTCERIWLDFEAYREEQKWSTMTAEGIQ